MPRFQSNIPSHLWYIARSFQIWSAPIGYEEFCESERAKYFERIIMTIMAPLRADELKRILFSDGLLERSRIGIIEASKN